MGLAAGSLRERVVVQAVTLTPDGSGGTTKAWTTTHESVPAMIEPLSGGEAFRAALANNTQMYRVTIRFRTDITPRNRLVWKGQVLNIRTCADPEMRREKLVMTAESGAPEPA